MECHILLFLHHVMAHTLPFSVRCHHKLQHVAHTSASWKAQTLIMLFLKRNSSRSFLDLLLQFRSIVLDQQTSLVAESHKQITQNTFYWSFMLHPFTRRMVGKPHISGKCKMLWCSILHEMRFVMIVPLSNSGQHTTMKHIQGVFIIHFVLYLLYNHPIIHTFCFYFNPFPCSRKLSKVACVHAMKVQLHLFLTSTWNGNYMGDQYLNCVCEKYTVKMSVGLNCFRIQFSCRLS